jgi:hypothetical protein
MSRSRRKTNKFGNTMAESEKDDKRRANRALRVALRSAMHDEDEVLPTREETSDEWTFAKDGKRYRRGIDPRWLRK